MSTLSTINFKIDQFKFARKSQHTVRFLLSLFNKDKRKEFSEFYDKRGLRGALSYGIAVPDGFPISSLQEVFYEHIYNIKGFEPKKTDIVVDVGANTGDWTIYCAKIIGVKKIYAFEPLKVNFIWAKALLDINKCENATLYNYAISNGEHSANVEYTGNMLGEFNNKLEKKKESINFRTLDSFNLECTVLKIDVEGFEMEVLKGSLDTIRKYKPNIILETHTRKLRQQCNEFLEKEGYILRVSGRIVKGSKTKNYSNLDEIVNLYYSHRDRNDL